MDYKKGFLVFLIICILFTVSSVVASDVNDTAIAGGNQNLMEVENQGEIVVDSDVLSEDIEAELGDDFLSLESDNQPVSACDSDSQIIGQSSEEILTSAHKWECSEFTVLCPLEGAEYRVGDEMTAAIIPNKFVYGSGPENYVCLYYYLNGEPYWSAYDSWQYTEKDVGNVLEKYGSTTLTSPGKFTVKVRFGQDFIGEYSFTIKKGKTVLSASKVTATYGISKKLVVTLKQGNGNKYPLSSKKVKIQVGSITKTLTTNDEGQISLVVSGLVPKTYTAKITFAGDGDNLKSSKFVKVTVKKANSKLAAKSKTFKKSVKTKKYTIKLKTNKNKAMKKVKVTLKIKGQKAITAKTSNKGIATFKIKALNKKGTFKSTVTFKGNKYYNKVTKKVNIKIK